MVGWGTNYRVQHARENAPTLSNCLFLLSLITRCSSTQFDLYLSLFHSVKLIVSLIGSHILILTGYFFFNCRILTPLYCTLSTFFLSSFPSSLFSLFSFLSTLFQVNSKEHTYIFITDGYGWACQLTDPGRSNICCYNAKANNFTRL